MSKDLCSIGPISILNATSGRRAVQEKRCCVHIHLESMCPFPFVLTCLNGLNGVNGAPDWPLLLSVGSAVTFLAHSYTDVPFPSALSTHLLKIQTCICHRSKILTLLFTSWIPSFLWSGLISNMRLRYIFIYRYVIPTNTINCRSLIVSVGNCFTVSFKLRLQWLMNQSQLIDC